MSNQTLNSSPNQSPELPQWRRIHWYKIPLFFTSLFLFMLAITLMKDGAKALAPLVKNLLAVNNFANTVGFGWLFSYVIMSGSPVAGAAMAFLDAGIVDQLGAYGMVVGSRFGASFIVLFIGFLYILRGRDRANSLSMGLLSLSVAWTMQFMAIWIGLLVFHYHLVDHIQIESASQLTDMTELLLVPISKFLLTYLPHWALFVIGMGLMVYTFNLFDRALPEMTLKEGGGGAISRLVYRPWVMFLLGSAVTFISMSVSISLGLLVPLSQRGIVRRENVVPYIMGANITTFIDTLIVAILFGNPAAFTVVLVEMISLTLVAMIILLLSYATYERMILRFVDWVTADTRHLAIFMLGIFGMPIILMLI